MSSLTSIEVIDHVLRVIYIDKKKNGLSFEELYNLMCSDLKVFPYDEYNYAKLKSTLKTLERGNYIYSELRRIKGRGIGKAMRFYYLSIEGEVLIERGGYKKRIKDIKNDERRLNLQFWFNIILSITSVGAIWVAWLEYKKNEDINVTNKLLISIKSKKQSEQKQDTSLKYCDSLKKKTK